MRNTTGLSASLVAVVSVGALLAGCKEGPNEQDPERAGAAAKSKTLKDINIGMSMYTLGAPYFAAQVNGAKKKAAELGLELVANEARDDMVAQLANVEDLLAQGIDLLILNPKDPQGLIPATKARFEIVAQGWGDWYHEGGLKAMEDIIVAHPEINVMLAENDSMALGALEAMREAGREDDILVLAAADGQKEALKLIKEGKYGVTGMNNPVLIAETAIEVGLAVLQGKADFPKVSYTPAVCITRENVDKYYDPNAVF